MKRSLQMIALSISLIYCLTCVFVRVRARACVSMEVIVNGCHMLPI